MVMDWLYPERAELRILNENLRRENKRLCVRIQSIENRMDKLGIQQFLSVYRCDDDSPEPEINTIKRFVIWVLR